MSSWRVPKFQHHISLRSSDGKKVMEWTKVCHCKLLLERVDDTTKKSCSGRIEVDVINIEEQVCRLAPLVEAEQ